MNNRRIAVYAASLDPITKGHEWLIDQAARGYDQLIVAIAINPNKAYFFSLEERLAMVKKTIHQPNVQFATVGNEYLVDFADRLQASYIVRGLRTTSDWDYEQAYQEFNRRRAPHITTTFFTPPPDLIYVSSSFVKGLVGPRGWHETVNEYVSPWVYQKFVEKRFRQLWLKWWQQADGNIANGQEIFANLAERYTSEHRAYHNQTHITTMLEMLEDHLNLASNPVPLAFAIAGHDAIYQPASSRNEEESTALLGYLLTDHGIPAKIIKQAISLIMITKTHQPNTPDEALMVDLDLAILGQSWTTYAAYADAIRQEYSQYSPEEYRSGRIKILNSFLERPIIYHTDTFRLLYEEQARQNLKQERQQLQEQSS